MKPVIWEPIALQELDDALAVSRSPPAFQRVVDDVLNGIASGRVVHARVSRSLGRQCDLITPPYSIIYVETDDEIRIYAFPHQKRRPNYWKNRLPKP